MLSVLVVDYGSVQQQCKWNTNKMCIETMVNTQLKKINFTINTIKEIDCLSPLVVMALKKQKYTRQCHSQKLCVGGGPSACPPIAPLPFPFLEVGPLKSSYRVWGSTVSSPSGSGQSPADKRFWVHFELKTALLVIASLKSIFMKQNAN